MNRNRTHNESPATLVAIIVAAHKAGDQDLERETRWKLQQRFGVKLRFARELQTKKEMSRAK